MANRMDAYADWLVANQNLKGSPQFQTVADAYKAMRQKKQPAQTTEASQKDTSFGSAFMQGIDRPLENIGTTLQATGLAPELGQTLKDATDAPTTTKVHQTGSLTLKRVMLPCLVLDMSIFLALSWNKQET